MNTSSEIQQFRIGDFKCTLLLDMIFSYQGQHYFSNIEKTESVPALKRYGQSFDKILSPFVSLLIEKEDHKILVDSGMGYMQEPVLFQGNPIQFKGKTNALLQENGTAPEAITQMIVTHFHPDHIGGICGADLQPNYPNAACVIHQDEMDFWSSSKADNQADIFRYFIKQNIDPLSDHHLSLISREEESITSGITLIQIPGHTPGQLAVKVQSAGESFLFVSDAWLHPLHIEHLNWQTIYDLDHDLAKKSRQRMLEMAYDENMLVQSFHFDFPGLGHIDKSKNGWRWVPLAK